ncbi:MAG TPA: GntR family transcriptional regulator [Anaerolineaceae bacterium]|nr:GntR family transcriptional regulator [Anaerolineaceae bacterium]
MSSSSRFDPRFQKQLASGTLAQQVYEAIHDSIICGRIHPGDPLRQAELAGELGVSARTVREAFSRLVAEGLAEYEPHRGVRVKRFTIADQEALYRMRSAIEGMAFEAAASRISPEELDYLREIVDLASQDTDPESVRTARHYNQEFHWTIIRASGNDQYIRILDQIWKSMFTYFEGYDLDDDHFTRREEDRSTHQAILNALAARDGNMARSMIEKHIQMTFEGQRRHLAEYLDQPSENVHADQ